MMPPKKSKAARESEEVNGFDDAPASEESGVDVENDSMDDEGTEDKVHKNIFAETTVEGKRKRTLPPTEAKLVEWFATHFEEKENVHYKFSHVHTAFLDECIVAGVPGMEDVVFKKRLTTSFPNGFAFKEDSVYFKEIKARKKINRPKGPQGDTIKMKRKEVLERAFKDLGNPVNGVRFNTVRQYISAKFPALGVDYKPNYVLSALQLGIQWGYVELLRGVGKSGVYRLFVEGRDVDAELEQLAKKKKEKDSKDKKDGEKSENTTEDEKTEGEDGKEKKEGDEEEDGKTDDEEKKKPKKKAAPVYKSRQGLIRHGNPARVEDCFPLAITFGTEPKCATQQRIANYIARHYPDANVEQRLKPCLEKGAEKGFWEHIGGKKYELTVDEFDPTDDDDMIGKVVNAIMACTEPKQCSAGLLKNYVVEFHPDFHVADHPFRFKKALERAEKCGDLVRLTGIGGSGSFQLSYVFQPSPVILAAQDTESDYEEDSEDEAVLEQKGGEADIRAYQDAYVPRPSKRRGKARQCASMSAADRNLLFQASREQKRVVSNGTSSSKKGRAKSKAGKRSRATPSTDSEDSEEEELPVRKSNKRGGSSSGGKRKRKVEEELPVYKSDELYKPRGTASRGGGGRARSPPPAKAKTPSKRTPAKAKATPKKAAKSPAKAKGKSPAKAKGKSPAKAVKTTPTKAALKAKPQVFEDSEEEEEEQPKGKRGRKSVGRPQYADDSDSDEDSSPRKKAKQSTPSKSKGNRSKRASEADSPRRSASRRSTATPTKYAELSDSEKSDEDDGPPRAKKGKKGGRRR